MFNISFGEIAVVAVIGLIIIGPRRLPETARFVGHLVSRVQRQVSGVKADIRREMDLEDIKSIQREYEDTTREIGKDFKAQEQTLRDAADFSTPTAPQTANDSAAKDTTPKMPQTPWPQTPPAAAVEESGDEKNTAETKPVETNAAAEKPAAENTAPDDANPAASAARGR